jgi:hypothetical protein
MKDSKIFDGRILVGRLRKPVEHLYRQYPIEFKGVKVSSKQEYESRDDMLGDLDNEGIL